MNTIINNNPLGFISNLGPTELLIILTIVLLLFGGKKLPEFARGLGKSMKEFKKATSEIEDDFKTAIENVDKEPERQPLESNKKTNV